MRLPMILVQPVFAYHIFHHCLLTCCAGASVTSVSCTLTSPTASMTSQQPANVSISNAQLQQFLSKAQVSYARTTCCRTHKNTYENIR